MSDLSRAVHNDHSGFLAALAALVKQFILMQLMGGHSPADARQLIADAHQLHADIEAHALASATDRSTQQDAGVSTK